MKRKTSIIILIISIISAIITISNPIENYFKDERLLEISLDENRVINKSIEKYKNFQNLTGKKNILSYDTKITFINKGNYTIKESDFAKLDPIIIHIEGMLNKENILISKKNSFFSDKYIEVIENKIILRPFILAKNHQFEISFINERDFGKTIKIGGVIANYEKLEFGVKKTKLEKFLNDNILNNNIILFLLIIIFYVISMSTIILPFYFIIRTHRRSIYFNFLMSKKLNPSLENYIRKVISKDYSINIFASEYIESAIKMKSLCNKDKQLKHLLSIHKEIIEVNSQKYSTNKLIETFIIEKNISIVNDKIILSEEFENLLNSFTKISISRIIKLFLNYLIEHKDEQFYQDIKKLETSLFDNIKN